jgi:uncharacterized protein
MKISLSKPREFVAQGDRALAVGFARGKIKATNKTWEDDSAPSHAARSSNAQP